MDTFQQIWQKFHPASPPVGHVLKWTEPSLWLRFHSLPDSKRYAESEQEMMEILRRMAILGDEVLGVGAPVLLILANPEPFPYEPEDVETIDLDIIDPETARQIRETNTLWKKRVDEFVNEHGLRWSHTFPFPDDECDYQVFNVATIWQSGNYRSLLQHIADDETDGFLWMSPNTGDIFAPYDGGIDLILHDPPRRQALKRQYADWLPAKEY